MIIGPGIEIHLSCTKIINHNTIFVFESYDYISTPTVNEWWQKEVDSGKRVWNACSKRVKTLVSYITRSVDVNNSIYKFVDNLEFYRKIETRTKPK